MKAATPKIPCSRCSGSGEVNLNDASWLALQLLRRAGRINAVQLHAQRIRRGHIDAGQRRSATNNLLEELRRQGLVTRIPVKRDGKWVYAPVKTK